MSPRVLQLEPFVSAAAVQQQLECSRSCAYEHLRRAARREPGARGLLRVRASVWNAIYAAEFVRMMSIDGFHAGDDESVKHASVDAWVLADAHHRNVRRDWR